MKKFCNAFAIFAIAAGLLIAPATILAGAPSVSAGVLPNAVDVSQTVDLTFTITSATGPFLQAIIDYSATGFSDPTNVTCPAGWDAPSIDTGAKKIRCSTPLGGVTYAEIGVVFSGVSSTQIGDNTFAITTDNFLDPGYGSFTTSASVNVKTLTANVGITPVTTNTSQARDYTFSATNSGQDSISQLVFDNGGFTVNSCAAAGWTCAPSGNSFTLSDNTLAPSAVVSISANMTAPASPSSETITGTITGSLGGTNSATMSPSTLTVQTPASLIFGAVTSDKAYISNLPGANNTATISAPVTNSGQTTANNFTKGLIIKDVSDVDISTQFTISETDSVTEIGGGATATLTWTVTTTGGSLEGLDKAEVGITYGDANDSTIRPSSAAPTEVFTVDNTVPTLPNVTTTSNNSDPTRAKVGDVITLNFTASENIQTPTVTIATNPVVANQVGDAQHWTATYTMTGGDSEGSVPFSVSFSDLAANAGAPVSVVTSGTAVTFDKTLPKFSPIVVAPSPAKSGTEVSVSFTASETLITDPTVTIGGQPATKFSQASLDYVYKRTLNGTETPGIATVSISGTDLASNVSTDTSGSLVIDFVAPNTSDDYGAKNDVWQKSNQTIILTPNDPAPSSGLAWTKYCTDTANTCDPASGTDYTIAVDITAEGTTYFRYASQDNAGNLQTTVSRTVKIDKINPASASVDSVIPFEEHSSTKYVRGTVTISASATDVLSDIQKVEFWHASLDTKIGEDLSAPYSIAWNTALASDGVHNVYVKAYDNAGNLLQSADYPVTVDNTLPTIPTYELAVGGLATTTADSVAFSPNSDGIKDTVAIDVAFSEEVNAYINIRDGAGGLIKQIYHDTVTNPTPKIWNGRNTGGSIVTDGVYTIEIIGTDHAGNEVINTAKTITLDTTAPTVNAGDDKLTKTTATTNATASDSGAGIATYAWTGDAGLTFTPADTLNTEISSALDGVFTGTLTVTDNVGNRASDTIQFTRDSVSPTLVMVWPTGGSYYKDGVPMKFTPDDPVPGTALTCSYEINTSPITDSFACASGVEIDRVIAGVPDGAHTMTVTVTDAAGNSVSSAAISFTVDTIPPTVVLTDDHTDAVVRDADVVKITATFTDANAIDETPANAPTITIGSTVAAMTKTDNLHWYYDWDVPSGNNGPISVSIAAKDVAGNGNTTTSGKTDYTIDNVLPTLNPIHIESNNNSDTKYAITGNTITLNFTASETLPVLPVAKILGNSATVTNTGGLNYSATYIVAGDADQVAPFTIDFTDVAGNVGAQVVAVSDGSSVTVDNTAPIGYSATIDQSQITVANQTAVSFTFAGAEVGTTYNYSIDDTDPVTPAITNSGAVILLNQNILGIDVSSLRDGTLTLTTTLTDKAGNVGINATDSKTKDTTAPTISTVSGTDAGPVKTDTINLTVADVNPPLTNEYGFSADTTCDATDTYGNSFTSGADFAIAGNHTDYLCAKATDSFSNIAYQYVGKLNTDNTNPALVLGSLFTGQTLTGGHIYPINWTSSDPNLGATPISLEYSIDDGATWGNWITIATENDGVHNWTVPTINSSSAKLKITSTDLAGNIASALSSTFTIAYSETTDATPPVVTVNSPNGAESWVGGSNHVITWTATDNVTAAGSLVVKLEYSTDGSATWSTIIGSTENDGAYLWTVPDSATTNALVRVTATDAVANSGSDLSNAVFTITAAPTHICTDLGGGNWSCNVSLNTGWNLISLPVIISDTAIANVLSGVVGNMDLVQYYNGGVWQVYKPGVSDTLTTIEDGKGYWINMTAPATLTVTGVKAPAAPASPPIYSVVSGWNLIGFKSIYTQLAANYLQTLPASSYTLLDAQSQNKNSGSMDSGDGYWLWMSTDGSIVTYSETE